MSVRRRWQEHRATLRSGRHHNRHLQNAWDKYGENDFEFVVVELCASSDLIAIEQRWLDETRAVELGFNLNPIAGSNLGVRYTAEARAKIAAWHTGRTLSDEAKAKISAAKKGVVYSDEVRAKMSIAHIGKRLGPMSAAAKAKLSEAKTGKKHTEETKLKKRVFSPEMRSEIVRLRREQIDFGRISQLVGISRASCHRIYHEETRAA